MRHWSKTEQPKVVDFPFDQYAFCTNSKCIWQQKQGGRLKIYRNDLLHLVHSVRGNTVICVFLPETTCKCEKYLLVMFTLGELFLRYGQGSYELPYRVGRTRWRVLFWLAKNGVGWDAYTILPLRTVEKMTRLWRNRAGRNAFSFSWPSACGFLRFPCEGNEGRTSYLDWMNELLLVLGIT